MNLDDFIAGSQLQLLAFKQAYQERAMNDAMFFPDRENADWWNEVASYHQYVELDEMFKRNEA